MRPGSPEFEAAAIYPTDRLCMECGGPPDATEELWTGDSESLGGYEIWSYCRKCKIDTFHKIKRKEPSAEIDSRRSSPTRSR